MKEITAAKAPHHMEGQKPDSPEAERLTFQIGLFRALVECKQGT